eukprot:scaffold47141_cov21-Tisochrysis_lutea.AAC.2
MLRCEGKAKPTCGPHVSPFGRALHHHASIHVASSCHHAIMPRALHHHASIHDVHVLVCRHETTLLCSYRHSTSQFHFTHHQKHSTDKCCTAACMSMQYALAFVYAYFRFIRSAFVEDDAEKVL